LNPKQPVLGVDIGGSSIKFCLFDSNRIVAHSTKEYVNGKTPDEIENIISEVIVDWKHTGGVGIGFPGLVEEGTIVDAPNLDSKWEGYNLSAQFNGKTGGRVLITNDADAAALAMAQETERWEVENILCLTLGTGIGSAWLKQGNLDAGTEFGRMIHPDLGCSLEEWASVRTMNEENLSMDAWSKRLVTVLDYLLEQFKPDRFILSGGITTSSEDWIEAIQSQTAVPIAISKYGDLTGAVGAAKLLSV
jgi:polyphosphate glucokinase